MKASSDLFDLIHSLSPHEKRYFRRFASQHVIGDENNYLRLFDAISKQEVYDEDALRVQFSGEKFIGRLPSEKNYLFGMVLKAMRRYRADKSVDLQVQDLLQDARFLEDRGLYPASQRLLLKARKLARQYERWPLLVQALSRQMEIHVKTGAKDLLGDIEAAIAESEEALAAYAALTERHHLYNRLLVETRIRYQDRRGEAIERLQSLLPAAEAPLEEAFSFFGQLKSLHIQALAAQLRGHPAEALAGFRAADQLWLDRPDLRNAHPRPYLANLANLISTCHFNDEVAQMAPLLDRLRQHKALDWDEEGERLQNLVFFELLYQMSSGQVEAATMLEKDALDLLSRFSGKVNAARKVALAYNLIVAHFILEDFKKALKWILRLQNDLAGEQRLDAQTAARLFQIVIYYERGDLELVESQCRSLRRNLRKAGGLLPLESRLLGFMQAWVDGKSGPEAHAELLKALSELENQAHAPGKAELRIWCQSRAEGKKMVDLI